MTQEHNRHHCGHRDHACVHRVPIFEHLNKDELDQIDMLVQHRHYPKGTFIFHEGEPSEQLYVVHSGIVKLSKLSETGKEQIIRFLFPGDFFGQFALLQESAHYADAELLEASEICTIGRHDFQSMLERNARMAYRFLLAVSDRLRQADEWLGSISLLETEKRIARMLLLLHEKNNGAFRFALPVQKKELAAWIGTTPETFSRKLAHYEQLGYITIAGRMVTVHEPARLRFASE